MEKPDFRVGDKVTVVSIQHREITPWDIHSFIIRDGKQMGFNNDSIFYHGHNLKITVEEKKPERWPWVNVYRENNGDIFTSISYKTEDDAKKCCFLKDCQYCHTIQLKPQRED